MKKIVGIIFVVLVLVGLAAIAPAMIATLKAPPALPEPSAGVEVMSEGAASSAETSDGLVSTAEVEMASADTAVVEEAAPVAAEPTTPVNLDIEKIMADRALGNDKAPIMVREYASLSCSHCAEFSKTIFDAFEEKYITTGLVYFVFDDFPLNAAALDAALVARCVPEDRYFQYVKHLFNTQNDWAFQPGDYRAKIVNSAKMLGAGETYLNACLNSEELRKALVTKIQTAQQKYALQTTPTFVIIGADKPNESKVVTGVMPVTEFDKHFAPYLRAAKKDAEVPAAATDAAPTESTGE